MMEIYQYDAGDLRPGIRLANREKNAQNAQSPDRRLRYT